MIKKFEKFSLFEDLGDIFYPLEDDWNLDILFLNGMEIEVEVLTIQRDVIGPFEFSKDPNHYYFYQEIGERGELFQTFTDGWGWDVMGTGYRTVRGDKIKFDYDLIGDILKKPSPIFPQEKREFTIIKIGVLREEFLKGNLIGEIKSRVGMAVSIFGLKIFNTKDPYYRNGVFGSIKANEMFEIDWMGGGELDPKKILGNISDSDLIIRICFSI